MSDDVSHIMLEHLKALRKDTSDIKADMQGLKIRMSSIEGVLGHMQTQIASQSIRTGLFDERLIRIERRLDLVEA